MADITHNDSVVTESKLKDFYEDIKPFLSCPAYVTQEGSSDYYNTEEKVIGRWIDGKPLYQKTFAPSTTYNAGTHNIATGITGIDRMVEIKGVQINNNTGDTFAIDENSNDYVGYIGGKIVYTKTSTGVTWKVIVTIKYTKTTDSAQTATITDPNEYSTDEKIIGKWIDGKPIYQKVLVVESTISQNGWIPFPNNNIDILIKYGGTGYYRTERHKRPFPWDVEGNYANINAWNSTGIEYSTNNPTNTLMSGSMIWLQYTKTTD